MRTMNTEKLIKTLPIIQNQLDALLDFQVITSIVGSALKKALNPSHNLKLEVYMQLYLALCCFVK